MFTTVDLLSCKRLAAKKFMECWGTQNCVSDNTTEFLFDCFIHQVKKMEVSLKNAAVCVRKNLICYSTYAVTDFASSSVRL